MMLKESSPSVSSPADGGRIILISHPAASENESQIINEILDQHSNVIFHLRKPDFTEDKVAGLIHAIKPDFYNRIVLHQHFSLAEDFGLKGIHLKESDRLKGITSSANVISTSFHSLEEALMSGDDFEYFFCSPVFQSISKPDYVSSENWNISSQSESFRTKAVALGGVDSSKRGQLQKLGFGNIAILGAVWHSRQPVTAFLEIVQAFDA